jgi:septal ring factor EnvC (AmiA/AmiB activator)
MTGNTTRGRSAQVESMRQQVAARDAEIQRLPRERAHVREMTGRMEENLERATAALTEHEAVFALTRHITDGAVSLTCLNDAHQWADSMLTADLTAVSNDHYSVLVTALSNAYTTVTSRPHSATGRSRAILAAMR